MPFHVKNWKLAILAVICIGILSSLGCWQWSRANTKKILLKSFAERTEHAPLSVEQLKALGSAVKPRDDRNSDLRFYRAKLIGHFDNTHTFLLDNKIHEGKIGYEVYTPFIAAGLTKPILIDRGFIPIGKSRRELPLIRNIIGNTTIEGILNLPPTYVSLGKMTDSSTIIWPLRVEYINLREMAPILQNSLYPYLLILNPKDPAAYDVTWQIVIMPPERHMGYAVQWFALALTLLVIFVALNRR